MSVSRESSEIGMDPVTGGRRLGLLRGTFPFSEPSGFLSPGIPKPP